MMVSWLGVGDAKIAAIKFIDGDNSVSIEHGHPNFKCHGPLTELVFEKQDSAWH